ERRLLFAVDDGVELDDPEFGGADLIVGTALPAAAGSRIAGERLVTPPPSGPPPFPPRPAGPCPR
ncbi:hypothetical protein ACWCQB_37545, partial [Streptomyces hirsutus]